MKEIEIGTNLAVTLVIALLCALIFAIVYFGLTAHTQRVKHYTENGYSRETLAGWSAPQWVKP